MVKAIFFALFCLVSPETFDAQGVRHAHHHHSKKHHAQRNAQIGDALATYLQRSEIA